jgi:two-component system, OmpR family, alkaline phosphatase synthesis response regulator PhoP
MNLGGENFMPETKKILIIEDDQDIADLIEIHLKDLGYELDCAADGLTGLDMFEDGQYALIILDVMLPKLDGLEVCKRIRQKNSYTPILMLTAKSEELDKILGLEFGADDYMTKPFSLRELLARIKAIFRRMEADKEVVTKTQKDLFSYQELSIHIKKRKVTLFEELIELTAKEFDLLVLFTSNPGRAYSRKELLDLVWGYQFDGYEHTVNSHINRLRNKIEKNPASPRFIKTVWGVGYSFADVEEM